MTPSGVDPASFRRKCNNYKELYFLKVKVTFTVEQAMKTQRGSRGVAILFL
jgi:hypothetical protein